MGITFIDELNEDCLIKILDYLSLKEQLEVWQATKSSISPNRVSSLLAYMWQKQTKHIIDRNIFIENKLYLEDYLECISESVEELEVRYLPINLVETFRQYEFRHMRKLNYYCDEEGPEIGDTDIAILTEIFPFLTSLVLIGMCTGRHINKFHHLTELDFEECWCLKHDNFMNICNQLKLRKLSIQWLKREGALYMNELLKLQELEELTLNLEALTKEDIAKILTLPKLRKLCFSSEGVISNQFNAIVEIRGLDIIGAIFNDSIWNCNTDILCQLQNLHKLTIIEDDGWSREDLMRIMYSLPSLEQVNMVESHILRNADQLWDMVRHCPKLKLLNISKNSLDDNLFIPGKEIMETALNGRKELLHLNLLETGLNKDLIRQHFQHTNLKISFKSLNIEHIANHYVQLQFKPLES